MEIFIAFICLKVFENGSLCCIISSFYSIFLSKSLLKSVTIRKKEGEGAINGKNTVVIAINYCVTFSLPSIAQKKKNVKKNKAK